MPGKNSQGGNKGKHDPSRDRLNSANTSEGGSGPKKISIWPEWTDAELATEKWDLGGPPGKGREKSKTPHITGVYDDPDGVLLPASLADPNSVVWRRPNDENIAEIFNKAAPVIVSNPESPVLDLWSCNKHLFHSQMICWIVGQLNALWQMRHSLGVDVGGAVEGEKEASLAWRPWEHIQPHPKGSPAPQINLAGKYCIRLYWMGCWRKVTVDDKLPFLEKALSTHRIDSGKSRAQVDKRGKEPTKLDKGAAEKGGRTSASTREGSDDKMKSDVELTALFPRTTVLNELWPALLMKAILKVVALDYTEGCASEEFGDSSIIHMLTGWTLYTIPLATPSPDVDTWNQLLDMLPLWVRPPSSEASEDGSEVPAEESRTERPVSPMGVAIPPRRKHIVVGSFKSGFPGPLPSKPPLTTPGLVEVSKTETVLKRFSVIPSDYNLITKPSFPVLLTQIRDQLLNPPPKEPPLPELKAPYYLGLKFRQRHPGVPTPPPTPPPAEPRFLELLPTIADYSGPDAGPLPMELSCNSVVISETSLNKTHSPSEASAAKISEKTSKAQTSSKLGISVTKPSERSLKASKEPVKEYVPEYVHAKKWIEYGEFAAAFSKICIFKNPCEFKNRDTYFDLTKTATTSVMRAATASSSRKGVSIAQHSSISKSQSAANDHDCLFVDSVEPVELLFVLSSLSNWREGGKDTHRCYLSAPTKENKSRGPLSPCRPSVSISVVFDQQGPTTPSSTPDQGQHAEPACAGSKGAAVAGEEDQPTPGTEHEGYKGRDKILNGSLVVETYSWRSVQFGEPVLQMATTGVKGALFSVPPGRHLWKLHVKAPIGHHLEIFSNSSFTLATEDSMFTYISQDCSRFLEYSTNMADALLSSSSAFGDPEALEDSLQSLLDMLLQCNLTAGHTKVLLSSALHSWSTHGKEHGLSDKTQTAWKAFLCRMFALVGEKLPAGSYSIDGEIRSIRSRLNVQFAKEGSLEKPDVPEAWQNRQPTPQEDGAARVISSCLRQYTKTKLEDTMVPGSAANSEAVSLLENSLPTLKEVAPKLGATVLYGMFKLDPTLVEQFPFCEDMKHQAYSAVYCGSFPPIQPNSWTIVLRKIFHVSEAQLVALYFQCPLPTSILRVIDNDTMTETPRVFQTTIPTTYQPNVNGYTLQAEAWSTGGTLEDTEDKRWRLRLATSSRDRPPVLEGVSTEEDMTIIEDSFHKQEVMDYCLPDREETLFRYRVIPTKKTEISAQVTTSKPDVLVKFEILDKGSSIATVEGRGVCTVPLCTLQPVGRTPSDGRRASVVNSTSDATEARQIPHKYILQARILRKSWPLSETAWPHIAVLHRQEDQGSAQKPGSGKKSKGKDKKKQVQAPPQTTPVQPQIDTSKPHWVLRVVTKGSAEECVEMKKDTEKADQLKSMMQAWEAEQPGRCKKAQESRQKFLEARAIREEKPAEDELNSTSTLDGAPQTSVLRPNLGPVKIWQMDLTPFTIKESDTPILLDEAEQTRRLEERQKLFKEYRISRQAVLEMRDEDRQRRNQAKVKQIELAEQWQAELDAQRKNLNAVRESIREKHLAKERAEAEKLRMQEEMQSPVGGRDSKANKAKGKKKK